MVGGGCQGVHQPAQLLNWALNSGPRAWMTGSLPTELSSPANLSTCIKSAHFTMKRQILVQKEKKGDRDRDRAQGRNRIPTVTLETKRVLKGQQVLAGRPLSLHSLCLSYYLSPTAGHTHKAASTEF